VLLDIDMPILTGWEVLEELEIMKEIVQNIFPFISFLPL
jgi:CheY-like chemotaxis protein